MEEVHPKSPAVFNGDFNDDNAEQVLARGAGGDNAVVTKVKDEV